jgi:hypothetical protein
MATRFIVPIIQVMSLKADFQNSSYELIFKPVNII